MQITIDLMKREDLDQVLEIEKDSFSSPWSLNAFQMELSDNHRYTHYLVARAGDQVLGYLGTWFIVDEVHITNIAVRPNVRRQGVGQLLLQYLFQIAKSCKMSAITLEVRPTNRPAQELYKKLGFRSVGIRPKYYQDNHEDAVIMWKTLEEQAD